MNSILLAYTTVSTKEEASQLANHVLEEGLVACINVFPGISSFYQWGEKFAILRKWGY